MKLRPEDHRWLTDSYPDLLHEAETNILVGEIDFCASYNASSGKLHIGTDADRRHPSFLSDFFAIRIELDAIDPAGWPTVFETDGRRLEIAKREGVDVIDLHFYSDGACCLDLRSTPERFLGLGSFMKELVPPFFYRLSYVDKHGLKAARRNLWGEYSHGDVGFGEYVRELIRIGNQSPGRNNPCPCGRGKKYKRCHLDQVKAVVSRRT